MATAQAIITEALQRIRVLQAGEVPSGDDAELCRTFLNTMLDSWNLEGQLLYTSSVTTVTQSNAASISIGPGQTINVARPTELGIGCYSRVANVDRPIRVIDIQEYDSIRLKSLGATYPDVIYYDGNHPTGNVYPWPLSSATLYLVLKYQFTSFADLTTDYPLPQAYRRTLVLSLAEEAAPAFGVPLDPKIERQAASARRSLRNTNANPPELNSDSITTGNGYSLADLLGGAR